MNTIWKYKFEQDFGFQEYEMPKGSVILSCGQDPAGNMSFWARVDDQAPMENHLIACVGTGWEIDSVLEAKGYHACFIGTVVRGPYVWHLFDLGAKLDSTDFKPHPETEGGARP